MITLNRIQPLMPAHSYVTYQIVSPLTTHWRQATCEEVGCVKWRNGWKITIDPATQLGQRQEYLIRSSGRKYTMERQPGGMTEYIFEAGQNCFEQPLHRVRLDRSALYIRRGGDWRGNPRGERYVHKNLF